MSHESTPLRVSLVGHCTPDAFALRNAIAGFYPEAQVEPINSLTEFEERMSDFDLHLINRVLDGSFAEATGIGLIQQHARQHAGLMLISNYPEAIEEAVRAGGVSGFGKQNMRSEQARISLHNAINETQSTN